MIESFLYHAGMEREQRENGGTERLHWRSVEHHPALQQQQLEQQESLVPELQNQLSGGQSCNVHRLR